MGGRVAAASRVSNILPGQEGGVGSRVGGRLTGDGDDGQLTAQADTTPGVMTDG